MQIRETAYGLQQQASAAVLRRRHRADFDGVEAFCLFVGYPRSGHSVFGSCLNAHRDCVVAHELGAQQLVVDGCGRDVLYSRILARASWFALRGNRTHYDYAIPGQWQGRFETLRVIGDKRGGAVTRCIEAHPDFLDRLRALVGVPLRLVHVVRDPFDNVAAISLWHDLSPADAAAYYVRHLETTARLGELTESSEVFTVHHEALVAEPRRVLGKLCAFAGLEPYPGWLEDCAATIWTAPARTREKIDWPAAVAREVEVAVERYPVLRGYG